MRTCVFLADGFEEIEGLTVVDVLRRAGVEVTTASVMGRKMIQGSHGIPVEADCLFEEAQAQEADLLVLPGGMPGTLNLKRHEGLIDLLKKFDGQEKKIAAICAAPSILGELGMLDGRAACAYPSFEDQLGGAKVLREPVVTDGHITTGRGMGAAIPFALRLAEILCGEEKAEEVRSLGENTGKNTGNMASCVLYCFNDCKCIPDFWTSAAQGRISIGLQKFNI